MEERLDGWAHSPVRLASESRGSPLYRQQCFPMPNPHHDGALQNASLPYHQTDKGCRRHDQERRAQYSYLKWDLRIKDKDGKKLSESDYRNMTKEEQAECTVRPYLKVYNEWNIDQTNLEEVNKEKYDAILKRFKSEPIKDEVGMYKNEAFDNLLKEQSWVCPIEYEKFNESAFYSPKETR